MQYSGKVISHHKLSPPKKNNLGKQWIFKDEKNLIYSIYSECLYYSISDELGCHGNQFH